MLLLKICSAPLLVALQRQICHERQTPRFLDLLFLSSRKKKTSLVPKTNYFVATPNSNIIQSGVNKDTLNTGLQSLWLNCKLSKQKTSLSSQTLSPFEPTETTNHKKEINICKGHMHYMQSNQNASLPNKLQGIARAAWRRQARASLHLLRSLA
jgi:DNA mismatch repair ATPase MutS